MNIDIVYSSHLGEHYNKDFEKHIHKTIGLNKNKYNIYCYENYGKYSLSEVYNKALKETKNDFVLFIHNDITFDTKNWGLVLLKILDSCDHGIIGLAGSKYMSENGKWWEVQQEMYGIVNHEKDGKKWVSVYSEEKKNKVEDVVVLDGVFLFVDKQHIKTNFNEKYKGFHFYDISFTYENYLKGVKLGVTTDIRITHKSIGEVNESWENNRKLFVETHKKDLGRKIWNNQNFDYDNYIFVHDQDIILKLEERNQFNPLMDYKYVFLGKGKTNKLTKFDNIIYPLNYEYNLEDYKYLCAYSGWWFLWKNNLIKQNKINLFEYDVELDNLFYLKNDKFHNKHLINYVPFDVNNYHFINNKDWVENLFVSVKKIYNIDIDKIVRNKIQKGLRYWMSTSNVTITKSFFNEYMQWAEPIFLDIKENKFAGHALERLLTFYCVIFNKKFDFNINVLKHYQMDSHKTQGHETVDYLDNHKKAISFSLFGNKPIYNVGCIENAKLIKTVYPKYEMVVYYSDDTDKNILQQLKDLNVNLQRGYDNIDPYFWRFLAINDYDVVLFRDCDSRLNKRESEAVKEWLKSDKKIHMMIDHPAQKIAYGANQQSILAGMWAIKKEVEPNINLVEQIVSYNKDHNFVYGQDQIFLKELYNKYKNHIFIHDYEGKNNKFTFNRINYQFVGERFDENNKRFEDYKQLI